MMFWIIYFLVQISFFWIVLGHFSQGNFKIFHYQPAMVADLFTQPPTTIKKLFTTLSYIDFFSNYAFFCLRNFEPKFWASYATDFKENNIFFIFIIGKWTTCIHISWMRIKVPNNLNIFLKPILQDIKLNVKNVFWTSNVRSFYVLCSGGKFECRILLLPTEIIVFKLGFCCFNASTFDIISSSFHS